MGAPRASEFLEAMYSFISMLEREARERGGYVAILERPRGPLAFIGDLHGDYITFKEILRLLEENDVLDNGLIVFLGDYVDRGPPEGQVGVLYELATLKSSLGSRLVVLRGNHEPPRNLEPVPHDYPDALRSIYSQRAEYIYSASRRLFDEMPHAAVIKGLALAVHAGPPTFGFERGILGYLASDRSDIKALIEILWNDPDDVIEYVAPNYLRGIGSLWGRKVTEKALEVVGVKVIIRGHEPVSSGFKLNHRGRVATIFSRLGAPYFNEEASILICDLEDLVSGNRITERCVVKLSSHRSV